jgi:glycosyltransferase involved in cell wall biosynthesis
VTATYLPKISIVTPSYNSVNLIGQTMQSILGQQYPDLEYLVIDGGSRDGTQEIIRSRAGELAYWCSEPDTGQYDAINKGFSRATGEVLGWLNSDDMLLPRALLLVGEIFARFEQVEWISSRRPGLWDADGNLIRLDLTPGFSKMAFLDGLYLPGTAPTGFWIQQESTFWRRSLWNKVGGRVPAYSLAGDFALWAQFYRHADLYAVDYPIGGFRTIVGQRTEAIRSYRVEALDALDSERRLHRWSPTREFERRFDAAERNSNNIQALVAEIGYRARMICNRAQRVPGGDWKIAEYRFLP